jgi:putative 4-mercaptohistidine N1-methyltranferase
VKPRYANRAEEKQVNNPSDYYESDTTLAQYLEFHYGEAWHGEANFPKELADAAFEALNGRETCRALDIGCAVGRTALELARHFDHVDGVDFSQTFVNTCRDVVASGMARYARPEEGELVSYQERSLAALGLAEAAQRVAFHQGDACDLGQGYRDYDLVLAGNLIDRLYKPSLFLETIHERINDLGLLVIASPYTWLEDYTPKSEWVGGYLKNGEPFTTLDGLKDMLAPHFRLLGEPRSLPFVIRETRNKFQHSFSELTIWEKLPA